MLIQKGKAEDVASTIAAPSSGTVEEAADVETKRLEVEAQLLEMRRSLTKSTIPGWALLVMFAGLATTPYMLTQPLWLQWVVGGPLSIIVFFYLGRDLVKDFKVILMGTKTLAELAVGKTRLDTEPTQPVLGEYLLHLLLPRENVDGVVGDLSERYLRMVAKYGKRKADVWYWVQVFISIAPILQGWGRRLRTWLIGGGLVWFVKTFVPSLLPTIQQWIDRFTMR